MWPELGVATGSLLMAAGVFHPRVPLFGPVCWHGPRNRNAVALTFDDGPHPEYTLTLGHILESRWKRATFFCVGEQAEKNPTVVQALAAAGHDVENHTYSHDTGRHLFQTKLLQKDLLRAQDVLTRLTGKAPTLFRPAVGVRNPPVHAAARALGLRVVTWTSAARDGLFPLSAARAARMAKHAKPGDILALHDGLRAQDAGLRAATLEHLPSLVDAILARGLDILPLSELLKPVRTA